MNQALKTLTLAALVTLASACTAITDVTSSTSSTLDAATPDVTMNDFIDKRYAAIRQEAARGGGENIDALAQLLGKQDSKQLGQWMQANYEQLFDGQQPQDLMARLQQFDDKSNG